MHINDNATLLFIGDSITDCGRNRPVGERAGLGGGYVSMANALIQGVYPEKKIRILNTGISGNRITDLKGRWKEDVLDLEPDWLSIMIGINDVWRHFDWEMNPNQVDITAYESIFNELLEKTKPKLKGLVLMTPYFIETNKDDPMRSMMDEYSAVVKKTAQKFDAVFVDVQAAFDEYLKSAPTQSLCGDRVHPNGTGHMIIAKAFLDALEFKFN